MKNKQTLILILVLIVLIILSAGFIGYTIYTSKKEGQEVSSTQETEVEEKAPIVVEEKEIEIFKRY